MVFSQEREEPVKTLRYASTAKRRQGGLDRTAALLPCELSHEAGVLCEISVPDGAPLMQANRPTVGTARKAPLMKREEKAMSKLVFEGTAVLELLAHAKAASRNTSPYGLTEDPGPRLFPVKDDGIYVMSNGELGLPGAETANKVVYARGYEALPATASVEERMARYDKIRDAVGGDDFAELLPAKSLAGLEPQGFLEIELSADKMTISVVRPPAGTIACRKVH
jgi:hypothetical protein